MSGAFAGEVSEEAAVVLLRRMLEIPSPSCAEGQLATYLLGALTRLGLAARLDQAGNVVGETGWGKGPHIMLLSHLDTVPGQIPVRSAAGRLYGRGASDAKGPLAAMICAAAGSAGFPGRITVIGVVEEEVPSARGAVVVRDSYPRPDACVIGEPSGGSSVVLGYKGKLDLRYTVRCPPVHPTSPGPKASELVTDFWAALKDILGPADHTVFALPGVTLESFSGDTAQATAKIGVRVPPGFDTGALLAKLRERQEAGTLAVLGARSPCVMERRNPVVRALAAGIRRRSGRPPKLLVKTATSDMNTLAEVWDIPMASYGPGESRLDHADDEHIVLGDYFQAIAVLSDALAGLADLPARRPTPRPASADHPR
jgi:[amino group carrier protein]-lysine/ornithine hydrolase